MTIRNALAALLTATAILAPAAQAAPADMHASTAQAAAAAREKAQPRQDLRSPDARDAVTPPHTVNAPGATARGSASELPAAGLPTRPASAAPVQAVAADDGGSPVPVIPLAAGALGMLLGALAALYGVRRTHRRGHIAA